MNYLDIVTYDYLLFGIIFNTRYIFKMVIVIFSIVVFLLNIRLSEISCNFYIDCQIMQISNFIDIIATVASRYNSSETSERFA